MNKFILNVLVIIVCITAISCKQTNRKKDGNQTNKTEPVIKKDSTGNNFLFEKFDFKKYHNARFDFCAWYPSKILVPHGESVNGDGQSFISGDMRYRMIVSGANNYNNLNISKGYQQDYDFYSSHNNYHLTFCKQKDNYYIISGLTGDNIFYTKTYCINDKLLTIYFEYVSRDCEVYNKLTEEILKKFPACN